METGRQGVRTYSDHSWAVLLLKLSEPASVYNARYDVPHVKRLSQVGAYDPVKLFRGV